MLIAFNKPYGVLSQFTRTHAQHRTLAEFGFPPGFYPIGRLDMDSEGLLLLSDEKKLTTAILSPSSHRKKVYWAQVEGIPSREDLKRLEAGVVLAGRATLPCKAHALQVQPSIPDRNPPIRQRHLIPTCWLEIHVKEGKNRQVRRMTAAIGFPTLRLFRPQIGKFRLQQLEPGEWRPLSLRERELVLS